MHVSALKCRHKTTVLTCACMQAFMPQHAAKRMRLVLQHHTSMRLAYSCVTLCALCQTELIALSPHQSSNLCRDRTPPLPQQE